jgi:ParB family chromosome partitioning protein
MTNLRQKIQIVDMGLVIPNTWNYNEQPEEMFEKTKANIEEFGMIKPVTVRENEDGRFEIINGFHRWLACKELGYKKISINNLGTVNDSEAQSLTVLLNEIKGTSNAVKMGQLIDSVYGSDHWEVILKTLPISSDELENYRKIYQDSLNSLAEVAKKEDEVEKETVYQLLVTEDQAQTIDLALGKFDEVVPVGDRFYEIALKYEMDKIA